MTPLDDLRAAVEAASAVLRDGGDGAGSAPSLERPPKPGMGDYSTNAAMLLSKALGRPPRAIAEELAPVLRQRLGALVDRVEVAGPGFLNLFLSDAWYADALAGALAAGDAFGGGAAARPERINVEFVSANPTGPVHLGHARNAAYGDALCRLLVFHGHEVHREYYVNDAGAQIAHFTDAVHARLRGEEPEQYGADYVIEAAEALRGVPVEELPAAAVARMLDGIRASLERFGVAPFDTWFSERTLLEGAIERTLDRLRERGATYESEGAVWLRSTDYGDDKDRVLVKSDGEYTYLTPDIAYHQDKRERGFERLIDVWGADHHGYVRRMKAAYAALGGDPDEMDLLIMQFAHLVRGGERASLSKRAGQIVTLDDLVDEIGADAARWFLLARSHDTTIDIDLDLAVRENAENPVYYVQYAHARIHSIRARAEERAEPAPAGPLDAHERALISKLLTFPTEVADAADRRAPHRIANYALDLARGFTAFYENCKVVGSDSEPFRLALCEATENVLARSLGLLGVSAPTEM